MGFLDPSGQASDLVNLPILRVRRFRPSIVDPWSTRHDQWLIIHGRAVGKLLAPPLVFVVRRDGLVEQQPHPAPCEALYSAAVFGALALRSLVACAFR